MKIKNLFISALVFLSFNNLISHNEIFNSDEIEYYKQTSAMTLGLVTAEVVLGLYLNSKVKSANANHNNFFGKIKKFKENNYDNLSYIKKALVLATGATANLCLLNAFQTKMYNNSWKVKNGYLSKIDFTQPVLFKIFKQSFKKNK